MKTDGGVAPESDGDVLQVTYDVETLGLFGLWTVERQDYFEEEEARHFADRLVDFHREAGRSVHVRIVSVIRTEVERLTSGAEKEKQT